jgi:hypothetical protein
MRVRDFASLRLISCSVLCYSGLLEWSVEQIVTTMGAKVEAEGYKLGYYAVGNLQAGANGWRSSYEEERTSNGEFCNGFMTADAVGYSDYDKEMFKRTMLAHEAAFRQQVPFD